MESNDHKVTKKVLLCAKPESYDILEWIGVAGITQGIYPWLILLADAHEIRSFVLQCDDLQEVWIMSSEGMPSLNLAAAIRKDSPSLSVSLIEPSPTGSFLSNAQAIGAQEVLTESTFSGYLLQACDQYGQAQLPNESFSLITSFSNPRNKIDSESIPTIDLTQCQGKTEDGDGGILIPVMSGSGGSGKSTVCALLSTLLKERGASVAVVDLDLQFGDMHRLLGNAAILDINDLLSKEISLLSNVSEGADSDASEGMSALVLVGAPHRLEHADLVRAHIGGILEGCQSAFDVVLVNVGASWDEHVARLVEQSPSPVFLVDQRSSSILGCKHALDLCTRMGIATSSFLFALNRCERGAIYTGIDISMTLQGAHVIELKDGGPEVEELLSAGMAEELCRTKNELVKSLQALLDEVISLNPRILADRGRRQRSKMKFGRSFINRQKSMNSKNEQDETTDLCHSVDPSSKLVPFLRW